MSNKPHTKSVTSDEDAPTSDGDAPLLEALGAGIKRMIARGKERGYVTYDELNGALPPEQVSSEQIEDTMAMLSEIGIVIEGEENEEGAPPPEVVESDVPTGNVDESEMGRTDDPVRMYLREMGNVELLSREGEIAIAKRIEAGREMMIGGICESPLTMRAIVRWYGALIEGRILLRDIIDLEATYDVAYRTTYSRPRRGSHAEIDLPEEKLKSCRYNETDFLYVHELLSRKMADGKDIDNGLLQMIIESAEYILLQRPSQYRDVRNALWLWRSYKRSKESDGLSLSLRRREM